MRLTIKPRFQDHWHFTQAKGDKRWHLVPNGLVRSVCKGTPRGPQAQEVADQDTFCRLCLRDGSRMIAGYVRRCTVCHEPLSEELPSNLKTCLECQREKDARRVVAHGFQGYARRGAYVSSDDVLGKDVG